MLFAVAAFAQKAPMAQLNMQTFNDNSKIAAMAKDRTTATKAHKAPAKAPDLVTLPDGAVADEWSIDGGTFNIGTSSGWSNGNNKLAIKVAIVGNDVYIQGLAYWFKQAWIKGTINGTTVTFPNTFVGEDEYGEEYLVGSTDGSTVSADGFAFTYDESANKLTQTTRYIFENGAADEVSPYCYATGLILTKGAAVKPDPVTPPAGLVTEEWTFNYNDYSSGEAKSFPVNIGFDGNDVYIQGLGSAVVSGMASAWVKGTRSGNTITVATDQFMGTYANQYDFYFVGYNGSVSDVTFTMNAAENEMTTSHYILLTSAASSLSGYVIFTDVVITKVLETPATPADPEAEEFVENQYGHYFTFSIPTVGTEGETLLTAKLYYQIYKDIEGEVAPFTLSADLYEKLDEDMSIIPYSFTDEWDIYPGATTQVYIYSDDLDSWNKIGVKAIYDGGGESHESEIVWLDIKPYTPTAITLNVTDEDEVALLPGATFQLEIVTIEPEGAEGEIIWTSSDEHIATVDENGLVTGMEFDGYAIRNGINQAPSDNDHFDYFPVTITATVASDNAATAPVSASVQMWVKSSTRTAITDVKAGGVESVKYVNAQGVVSSTPFDGVNIKVTRMSDGTTNTVKVIK